MTQKAKTTKKGTARKKLIAGFGSMLSRMMKRIAGLCGIILSAMRKRPAVVCGIALSAIGILLLVIVLVPGNIGKLGQWVQERFLTVVFGKASVLAGVYCLGLGLVLLAARKRMRFFAALTCLFIPALVFADVFFSTTQPAPDSVEVAHSVYIGYVLRMVLMYTGLAALSLGLLFCGIILFTPQSVLSFVRHRVRTSREQKALSRQASDHGKPITGVAQDQPKEFADHAGTSPAALLEETPSSKAESRLLNLKLYDREFVKIPTGLFQEHVAFNTTLPPGTRRQEIIDAFAAVNVEVDIGDIRRGPSFEQYEIIPGQAVKVAQIRSCVDDVSLRIKQKVNISKRTSSSLSIEVPLAERQTVPCGFLLEDTADDNMEIPIAVGVGASFAPFSVDLVELPHLLIAGTTGSGKSIFLKTLIASIMYHLTPNEARLVLVDPKRVEFGIFSSSLFCACDIITDFEKVAPVFDALVAEMEERYELLERAGASSIRQYNTRVKPQSRKPYVIAVVDEFADLLMQKVEGFEEAMIRLAQKARACGIHLVLATQRPSADVIKGLLKTNVPGRIAMSVSSRADSRIILDMAGAENLTGKGDLICVCPAFREGIRLQGAYITNPEIKRIIAAKS